MPDISMCNQPCPLRFKCRRHEASGTKPSDYQCYAMFEYKNGQCKDFWQTHEAESKNNKQRTMK